MKNCWISLILIAIKCLQAQRPISKPIYKNENPKLGHLNKLLNLKMEY